NGGKGVQGALSKGLSYLTARTSAASDPYVVALSILAHVRSGRNDVAAALAERLVSQAHLKDGMAYWELTGNTLFHSWGLPGQVEVTALALRALHAVSPGDDESTTHLIHQGLLFLAHKQDHYGVWYSGQTTWNVLSVMLELTKKSSGAEQPVEANLVINGKVAERVVIPQGKRSDGPVYVDVTNYIVAGKNTLEIQATTALALAGAQVSANYFVPWNSASRQQAW